MLAQRNRALVDIHTGPVVPSQVKPVSAGTLESPLLVDADVSAATIGGRTLIYI